MVGSGHQHSLVDAVVLPSSLRYVQLKRDLAIWLPRKCLKCCTTIHSNTCRIWPGIILLKNKARVLQKETVVPLEWDSKGMAVRRRTAVL
ncbi:hypothetical protein TNCV_3506821 [Trichonephila clavipes]|uniref:Uncharacterized protein n=1 Tax=Trichonephila clavipes TaxID=2585209 RepID=A0A8X6S4M8_TRICX|nr:hypothetical protein TNCV_3506821 [Trichonephila clavipes]